MISYVSLVAFLRNTVGRGLAIGAMVACLAAPVAAAPLNIVNAGFEDTTGQNPFNEFTFGTPTGWTLHDPNLITGGPGFFTGTLQPNNVDFFNGPIAAPEGSRVGILFNSQGRDTGEYGFQQILTDSVQANTRYQLSVEVGNIASGDASNGDSFNLNGFPGYRVELFAIDLFMNETELVKDLDTLIIPEAEFALSTISVDIGAGHTAIGDMLGIRLVNLNETRGEAGPPDLEVDFDDVRLDATAISEPGMAVLALLGVIALGLGRHAGRKSRFVAVTA
jgi:hapalindole H/12-epi-hapalindole U/12-epi-fischerindole U synthase